MSEIGNEIELESKDISEWIEWNSLIPSLYSKIYNEVLEYSANSVCWIYGGKHKRLIISTKYHSLFKNNEYILKSKLVLVEFREDNFEVEENREVRRMDGLYNLNSDPVNKYMKVLDSFYQDKVNSKLFAFKIKESNFEIVKESSIDINERSFVTINRGIIQDTDTYRYQNIENLIFSVMSNNEIQLFLEKNGKLIYFTKLIIQEYLENFSYSITCIEYLEDRKVVLVSCDNSIYMFSLENISNPYIKNSHPNCYDFFKNENFLDSKITPFEKFSNQENIINCIKLSNHFNNLLFSSGLDRVITL